MDNHKKKSTQHVTRRQASEADGTYLLKLISVFLIGTVWLKLQQPAQLVGISLAGLPLGLMIGLITIHAFEHRIDDRKILYATLLISVVVSFFLPAGIVL